ncbi:Mo-dependent nitrogenase C-terminal domain-containing protein [Anabaena sp. FACHB-1237]|uniref:Mo-dependent nitrogenase C-terminal domain-containing protein n=1 Tax=Anabaena sp. FACHB-1237 TaxID=2692769 RepID=UPI0016817AE2|nr:Mo-dependent nitrogenase C-terminal domain-containing protein [Anabaena sp. FACHB-1237]MBD2136153.1 Mo-dependent nitrogenase C-terminal domain-containing protein [Anabaena sp. FACHB-1237]
MIKTNTQSLILPTLITAIGEMQELVNQLQVKLNLLQQLRNWCDGIEVKDAQFAHFIAKLIPAQCPFERDIVIFGRKIGHIPPLCKLNPLYEQFVGLRFRALCYLVDECGQDIQSYC